LLLELADKCEEIGIEFMVTVFSPETLEMIAPRLKTIKIASSDIDELVMIDAVIDKYKENKEWFVEHASADFLKLD
jgi:sialic acid synthase SpsE